MTSTVPLFPLSAVLFPGARLPLRIFESRYLDMVRDCLRNESGFGVIWRPEDNTAAAAGHARIGTEAQIVDFSTLEDGLLGIECRGSRRFLVRSTRCRDNGLLIAEVDWLQDRPTGPIAARHGTLQALLRQILAHRELADQLDADPEDASSLGLGLAGILSIDLPRAQQLLETVVPEQRLDLLLELIDALADRDQSGQA